MLYISYINDMFIIAIIRIKYSYIYNHIYQIFLLCYIHHMFIKSNKRFLFPKVNFLVLLIFYIL